MERIDISEQMGDLFTYKRIMPICGDATRSMARTKDTITTPSIVVVSLVGLSDTIKEANYASANAGQKMYFLWKENEWKMENASY